MLGITPADAVAVGMFILAVAAAWRGVKAGDHAKRHQAPPDAVSIGATVFADTAAMSMLNQTLERIADAIEAQNRGYQERQTSRMAEALEALTKKLDHQDEIKKTPRR